MLKVIYTLELNFIKVIINIQFRHPNNFGNVGINMSCFLSSVGTSDIVHY